MNRGKSCLNRRAREWLPTELASQNEAVLLSPGEVARALQTSPEPVRGTLSDKWCLSGLVSNEMYDALSANFPYDVAARLTLLPTPSGAVYVVVASQIGRSQHRFLLPTYEPRVRDFMASTVQRGVIYVCLGPSDFDVCRTFQCDVPSNIALGILELLASQYPQDARAFIPELNTLVGLLAKPVLIPSLLPKSTVTEVEFSVFLPFQGGYGQSKSRPSKSST